RLARICRFPVLTYGLHGNQNISAQRLRMSPRGSEYMLHLRSAIYPMKIHLIGTYNVYNALAAAGAALQMGISHQTIITGLQELRGVPGRMEKVPVDKPYTVIVDYAHTNDALHNVLQTLSALKHRRLYTVFGCGGNRDRKKRPLMGRIAANLSTHAFITLDNPREEDPEHIMRDIVTGITRVGRKNFSVIYDRREAIEKALHAARKDDIVLIAGKGHEQYQVIGTKTIPFDDKKTVMDIAG
ncbi:MAG: UDP-N-acetylmuramyl-tripeptide synthetase, partial [Elusimicrobia bacterium]|nr:UDP-N-acetylmuramyl-tripeptide synthetase [Elusimicrobiota bacterium]MBD3411728.1 UDP-N-acetylmuramyl-tripeptide synthetase [Elusimicrobiota bacterium]